MRAKNIEIFDRPYARFCLRTKGRGDGAGIFGTNMFFDVLGFSFCRKISDQRCRTRVNRGARPSFRKFLCLGSAIAENAS